MQALWDQLRHLFTGPQLPWMILWLGLAALIVGLIVLTRTSWGQSHPLQKCAAMSLLVHLLLAAYATTFEIVTAGSPEGTSDRAAVSMILVNDGGDAPQATSDKQQNIFDKLAAAAATTPEAVHLDNPAPLPAVELPQPSAARDALDSAKPLLDKLPAMLTSLVKPTADPIVSAPAPHLESPATPATAIETVKAVAPQPAAMPQPDALSPPRQSMAPSDATAGDPDAGRTSSNAKPMTTAPGPDIAPPAELPGVKGADELHLGSSEKTITPVPLAAAPIDKVADNKSPAPAASGNPKAATADNRAGTGSGESQLVMVPVPGSARASSGRPATAPATGAATEPEEYRDRTASDRAGIVRRHGGSPETEAAVQAALKWLATHQSPDGHWDADKYGAGREDSVLGQNRKGAGARANTAVTGLALLALLGSGNTHLEGPYADNVRRGLNYLISMQGADGNLGGQAEGFAFMYSHGIATFALSESYAMTHDRRLERPLRAAIGYTLNAQHPVTGGWRYQPHETGDTSQLGWQLMALKSAELAGIPMPETARDGAVRFLKSVASGSSGGLASYRPNELPSRPMTAEALVCRQFLGVTRDNPSSGEAADYLLGELPNKQRINLYYWYYGTLSMYQMQGDHWQRWNEALQGALLDQQITEGDLAGSWDPKCIWGGYGGRIYSTSMSALCLEVYYRYLPLYNGEPGQEADAVNARRSKK